MLAWCWHCLGAVLELPSHGYASPAMGPNLPDVRRSDDDLARYGNDFKDRQGQGGSAAADGR